jgi:hypothetical protein
MRERADAERVRAFLRELGRRSDVSARVYLTGGATAVLEGWRRSTVDIDLRFEPDDNRLLRVRRGPWSCSDASSPAFTATPPSILTPSPPRSAGRSALIDKGLTGRLRAPAGGGRGAAEADQEQP